MDRQRQKKCVLGIIFNAQQLSTNYRGQLPISNQVPKTSDRPARKAAGWGAASAVPALAPAHRGARGGRSLTPRNRAACGAG